MYAGRAFKQRFFFLDLLDTKLLPFLHVKEHITPSQHMWRFGAP